MPSPLDNQHFKIEQWRRSHFRKATCREVECDGYLYGWKTFVPPDSVQANYIRTNSRREFIEAKVSTDLSEFSFPPGQRCFASGTHGWQIREPTASQTLADKYGNPGKGRVFDRGEDFNDSFNEQAYRINQRRR